MNVPAGSGNVKPPEPNQLCVGIPTATAGWSLSLVKMALKSRVLVAWPSLAVRRMASVPAPAGGLPVNVRLFGLKLSHEGSGCPPASAAETVIASPSASETAVHGTLKVFVPEPEMDWSLTAVHTGARLRFVTVSVNVPNIHSALWFNWANQPSLLGNRR